MIILSHKYQHEGIVESEALNYAYFEVKNYHGSVTDTFHHLEEFFNKAKHRQDIIKYYLNFNKTH